MTAVVAERMSGGSQADSSSSMVERVTLIMDHLERTRSRLTLEEVTQATRLPRTTTLRILNQLVRAGWLDRDGKRYGLGARARLLGANEVDFQRLRAASHTELHQIAFHTGMVVHLAGMVNDEIRYLDKFGGRNAVSIPSQVGARVPATCTALGKSILAALPPEQVDEDFGDQLQSRTERSIDGLNALHLELTRIRSRKGIAVERGECYPEIACMGVAIRTRSGPIGAISIVGAADAQFDRLVPVLLGCARRIGSEVVGLDDGPEGRPRKA